MCPLVNELKSRKNIETVVCVTGQHKEMLQQVLDIFKITPEYDLGIMKKGQDLFDITTAILTSIKEVLAKEKPATSIQAENAAIIETHNIVNFQDLISSTL